MQYLPENKQKITVKQVSIWLCSWCFTWVPFKHCFRSITVARSRFVSWLSCSSIRFVGPECTECSLGSRNICGCMVGKWYDVGIEKVLTLRLVHWWQVCSQLCRLKLHRNAPVLMGNWESVATCWEQNHITHSCLPHHSHSHSLSFCHKFAHRPDSLHTDKDTDTLRHILDSYHDHRPAHTQDSHR